MLKTLTNLKQINNKSQFIVNLYKDIVLVTLPRIFCTTLFINNNTKVVIQMHAFLMDRMSNLEYLIWFNIRQLNI